MEVGQRINRKGSRTLGYLRGEIEFIKEREERTHTLVFIGEKMDLVQSIVECLIEDSRMPLTDISRITGIPISTVYYNIKRIREHFRFTIVPKSICFDKERVLFELEQTKMNDFQPKAEDKCGKP